MIIRTIDSITPDIESLAVQASREDFDSVQRLVSEFASGTNRFDQAGECLLGVFDSGRMVGIGGINVEPYEPASGAGRLRRLYVIKRLRRHGIGAELLGNLEARAKPWFPRLQLFAPSEQAAAFYESMGYERQERYKVSHSKELTDNVQVVPNTPGKP
jgi:GNAT superfamily N-acetyltransferase